MTTRGTTRIEFALLAEDAELIQRYATAHHTTVSEIVRQALYNDNPVLKRAKAEREERTWREVEDRRRLREWNEGAGLADRDPQMRKLREAMDEQ